MDKKSKILVVVFILTVLSAVSITFYETIMMEDFTVIEEAA